MIKIITGKYGHKEGRLTVLKDAKSEPFSTTSALEAQLVKDGIAEYVKTEGGENPPSADGKTAYNESMGLVDLKAIAANEYKITEGDLKKCISKKAVIALIEAVKAAEEESEETEEEVETETETEEDEEVETEGGENPPLGDATEAVQ